MNETWNASEAPQYAGTNQSPGPTVVYDWFIYEADFTGIAPGASQTQTISIEADSNFLWQQGVYAANIAYAAYEIGTQPIPNAGVVIQDTGSGRNLMSSAVPLQNFFGLGREPFCLFSARWFRANTTFKVTVNNYDAADTYNLNLSFIGLKAFYYTGSVRVTPPAPAVTTA